MATGDWTCSQKDSKRVIDFLVVSEALAPRLQVEVDMTSPWTPHRGLWITLTGLAEDVLLKQQAAAPQLVVHQGPTLPWKTFIDQAWQDINGAPAQADFWIRPGSTTSQVDDHYRAFSQAVVRQNSARMTEQKATLK